MLRFAPRPTADMDLDALRIALLNFLAAKQRTEDFIVRIADTDKEKNIEGKDQEIFDIVSVFGITYTQSLYESQNFRFHSAMALDLLHKKKAFSCFCSDEWLENKKKEAQEKNIPYYYDDACRNLPAELVIDNENPFRIRIVRPSGDIVHGVDSFVIMNQDKTPTYDFATGVDDMLNDISLVITLENEQHATYKHQYIRDSLGYDKEIEYIYISSLQNQENYTIKGLLEAGYLPDAISNYLISLSCTPPCEIFTLQEALAWFDYKTITTTTTSFDLAKLQYYNKEHLKKLDPKELSRYVGFADADIGKLARLYIDTVTTTKELKKVIEPIFAPRNIPNEMQEDITKIQECLQQAPYCDDYEAFVSYIHEQTNIPLQQLHQELRVLLTNNTQETPELSSVYDALKNYIGEIIKK